MSTGLHEYCASGRENGRNSDPARNKHNRTVFHTCLLWEKRRGGRYGGLALFFNFLSCNVKVLGIFMAEQMAVKARRRWEVLRYLSAIFTPLKWPGEDKGRWRLVHEVGGVCVALCLDEQPLGGSWGSGWPCWLLAESQDISCLSSGKKWRACNAVACAAAVLLWRLFPLIIISVIRMCCWCCLRLFFKQTNLHVNSTAASLGCPQALQ